MAADLNERLSPNFTLRELVKSQTAVRLGIENLPNDAQLAALRHLCRWILQPVRERFGATNVSSGLRVLALNRAVGSGDNSQHTRGEAADFECVAADNLEVAQWIRDNLEFDQLILEFYTPGDPRSGWVHCSVKDSDDNRGEVLTASRGPDGRTVYSAGLAA